MSKLVLLMKQPLVLTVWFIVIMVMKGGLCTVFQLPGDQALGLIQKGPQVQCVAVSFTLVVASLGPLDGLFYLIDSFF